MTINNIVINYIKMKRSEIVKAALNNNFDSSSANALIERMFVIVNDLAETLYDQLSTGDYIDNHLNPRLNPNISPILLKYLCDALRVEVWAKNGGMYVYSYLKLSQVINRSEGDVLYPLPDHYNPPYHELVDNEPKDAGNTVMQTHSQKNPDSKQSRSIINGLTQKGLALLYIFEGKQITTTNCNDIAAKHGWKSGGKLCTKYNALLKKPERTGERKESSESRATGAMTKVYKDVIKLLEGEPKKQAQNELEEIEARLNNSY
jgi:hypothetical protein